MNLVAALAAFAVAAVVLWLLPRAFSGRRAAELGIVASLVALAELARVPIGAPGTLWDEVDRSWIVRQRRGDRAADAAPVPISVGEAVPVDSRRLEMTDQHARRPIRFGRDRRRRPGDDAPERIVLGHFQREHAPAARFERPPRPQDDAARIGIAGRDALGIKIAPLTPRDG